MAAEDLATARRAIDLVLRRRHLGGLIRLGEALLAREWPRLERETLVGDLFAALDHGGRVRVTPDLERVAARIEHEQLQCAAKDALFRDGGREWRRALLPASSAWGVVVHNRFPVAAPAPLTRSRRVPVIDPAARDQWDTVTRLVTDLGSQPPTHPPALGEDFNYGGGSLGLALAAATMVELGWIECLNDVVFMGALSLRGEDGTESPLARCRVNPVDDEALKLLAAYEDGGARLAVVARSERSTALSNLRRSGVEITTLERAIGGHGLAVVELESLEDLAWLGSRSWWRTTS